MEFEFPVAIVGAGPIGLAAAAHLTLRGLPVSVFEAGPTIAANLRDWSHVRLFSMWDQCVDGAAVTLLKRHGWFDVPRSKLPTGGDLVRDYLEPLAATPELADVIATNAKVVRIARMGLDRMSAKSRAGRPFELTIADGGGKKRKILAQAVIDTSGTWQNPNPIGADGWPAEGEEDHHESIRYGIPDVSGAERAIYAGRRTVVVGGGHSAANALLDLALVAEQAPATAITWVIRGSSFATAFGGGAADRLPARGALGERLKVLAESGRLTIIKSFAVRRVGHNGQGLILESETRTIGPFDRIIAATGQRPDFGFARELQLDIDPAVESTRTLGPLIDPNVHSCGTVPPHGWRELAHPEPGYFVAGIKSYGRAPTFLLLTGYEQVRSITAHLAGDRVAADAIQLALPETGICSATLDQVAPGGLCCAGAAADAVEPCCERPAEERSSPCCSEGTRSAQRGNAPACCG